MKTITVGDIIKLFGEDCASDHGSDILPNSIYKIDLCYMCENETRVRLYPEHPLLTYIWDVPVQAIGLDDNYVLELWIPEEFWRSASMAPADSGEGNNDGQ